MESPISLKLGRLSHSVIEQMHSNSVGDRNMSYTKRCSLSVDDNESGRNVVTARYKIAQGMFVVVFVS